MGRVTAEELTELDPPTAAVRILGASLKVDDVRVRIVEVEAYGSQRDGPWPDPAAHTFRGMNARNHVMFGPAGHLYVYRSHGIHACANIAIGHKGVGCGVLMRGAVVEGGVELVTQRRPAVLDPGKLLRGPGNLAAGLGITLADNGADVFRGDRIRLILGEPVEYLAGPRVGVSVASEVPWRFWIPGSPGVSAYRRSPRAPALP